MNNQVKNEVKRIINTGENISYDDLWTVINNMYDRGVNRRVCNCLDTDNCTYYHSTDEVENNLNMSIHFEDVSKQFIDNDADSPVLEDFLDNGMYLEYYRVENEYTFIDNHLDNGCIYAYDSYDGIMYQLHFSIDGC